LNIDTICCSISTQEDFSLSEKPRSIPVENLYIHGTAVSYLKNFLKDVLLKLNVSLDELINGDGDYIAITKKIFQYKALVLNQYDLFDSY